MPAFDFAPDPPPDDPRPVRFSATASADAGRVVLSVRGELDLDTVAEVRVSGTTSLFVLDVHSSDDPAPDRRADIALEA